LFTPLAGVTAKSTAKEGGQKEYIRKALKPVILPVSGTEPLTAAQMAVTAAVGAPISVVPVSMAAVFPLPMLTLLPSTVTPDEQHV
jgi:hypothetical protein